MIVIDYPPGGLGNFVAQVITNSINYDDSNLSFHRTTTTAKDIIDSELTVDSEESFLQNITTWASTAEVCLIHSYGQLDKLIEKVNSSIYYQIVVSKKIEIYILNQYLKALADNPNGEKYMQDYVEKYFGSAEPWQYREHVYLQYHWLKTPSYVNTPNKQANIIYFDNFYKDQNSFCKEIKKINRDIDVNKVYNKFIQTQRFLLDKINLYDSIILAVAQGSNKTIPENLSMIDQGIISGMLSDQYKNIEFQLPNNNNWFNNTDEIINLIKQYDTV